ncbi:tetratricopeptide repeat protein [Geomonas edaphica]|uniref:tetratricopeptide repeat protein n=1 Tax=Geomonas edaphica TaxID=2570226 RepID=UPI0010A7CF2B|nr:tetratricopeptide repeat protein [Geomonas edaphica]
MGIFSRMFGNQDNKTATQVVDANFITTLAMHVRGEVEPALASYQAMTERDANDFLALFFTAAAKADSGAVEEAVQGLRALSAHIAETGESISRIVAMELANLLHEDVVTVRVGDVTALLVSFGDLLKREGFVKESAVCFEIAVGLAPDNAHMLHKLGDTLHDLRIYDYAESVLKEAIKHAPHHFGALYTYAVLLQDLGRNEEALTLYEQAVKLVPSHVNCQSNYGAALLRADRVDEAMEHLNHALRLDPGAPLVKVNLGYVYLLKDDLETARKMFSEALALNDKLAPAYYGLASIERALGSDAPVVRALYEKALEANPSIAEAHLALANLLASLGDEQAVTHYATALQLNSSLPNLRRDFGQACLQLGHREEALELLKMAVMLDPDDALARELLAQAEATPAEN